MEPEAVEGLVDLAALAGDGEAGELQAVRPDGGDGGPVVDVVPGLEQVVGVDGDGEVPVERPPERPPERLAFVATRIVGHLDRRAPHAQSPERRIAHRLRYLLDARWAEAMTLESAAAALDRSVTHVARAFTNEFGVPPHAYVVGRRVGEARRLLLDGKAPAEVAAMTGFVDQAHLTRHFKRHVATTAGRFVKRSA